jgi:peptidoglycan hydrolase-like protein with peptidoglycan-binding domain
LEYGCVSRNLFRGLYRKSTNSTSTDSTTANSYPEVALKDMPTVKKGSTGNAVVTLQSLLIQRGYMSDKPANRDGAFGDGTHNVVVKYQQDKGLSVDGVVGSQTWGRLGYN